MEKGKPIFSAERGVSPGESELEHKQLAIERFVRMSGILEQSSADKNTEQEIETALKGMTPEERAVRIYENIVAFNLEKRSEKDKQPEEKTAPDPYFISEFKLLWNDESAREIFLKKYGEARVNITSNRISELGKELREIENSISSTQDELVALKQDLVLQKIDKPTQVKSAQARLGYRRHQLQELLRQENSIIKLEDYEHVEENTDFSALVMYETLRRYQREAAAGFAWLPSRRDILEKSNAVIDHSGKAPLLIGPPGTGKTTLIDSLAHERTNAGAIRIPCHSGLSEEGLVYIRDLRADEGAYDYQGTVTEAATGYMHSSADKPTVNHGRVANLDEISQLSIDRALGPIKDIRQAKVGKLFSRFAQFKTLPGFQLTATSNTPIADERLDREFGRVPTNYFEMNHDNPELYEFMLAKLMREEGNLPLIDRHALAPFYEKHVLPKKQRRKLEDGSMIIAEEKLVQNPADVRHGFLYRFASAVRAIQDSYIHGSQFNEKHLAMTAVYEHYDGAGDLIVKGYVTDIEDKPQVPGGQMLKLKSGSSTVTAEIVSKWMDGFTSSGEKDLSKWLQQMLNEHIGQTSPEDADRIKAIANYFHLLDEIKIAGSPQPLTPKEIGYLSPRVPRPVQVERPKAKKPKGSNKKETQPVEKELKTDVVYLESGEEVRIKIQELAIGSGDEKMTVELGRNVRLQDKNFSFAGVVEDDKSEHNGQPVGKIAGKQEELYQVLDLKEIPLGVEEYDTHKIIEDIENDFPELVKNYWEVMCKDNQKNNPDKETLDI